MFCFLRDEEVVRGIAVRPQQEYFGRELFVKVFEKAAALLHGFATTQYFHDGNKRTSFLSATLFLETNGYEWISPEVDKLKDSSRLAG